jgi:kumamolisin
VGRPAAAKVEDIVADHARLRPRLTSREMVEHQCADDAHIAAVRRFAKAHGLRVVDVSHLRHDVVLEGAPEVINAAFGVELRHYAHRHGVYRAHPGPIHVPEELADAVECVLGLDNIPLLDPKPAPAAAHDPAIKTLMTPHDVAEYYRFPSATTGKGQRITLIEFGGGYHARDIQAFFKSMGIAMPAIKDRCLPGAKNDPLDHRLLREIITASKTDPAAAAQRYGEHLNDFISTLEVTMDLEIAGSLAPDAEIDVLFAPPTGKAWRDAIYAALHEPAATVISISWGNAEYRFSESHVHGINDALKAARLAHVTVCCSSGDFGSRATSTAIESNGVANVAFPASSPLVLACGGTALKRVGPNIVDEVAWNSPMMGIRYATGGGISGRFRLPKYQTNVRTMASKRSADARIWKTPSHAKTRGYRGRGVPDVAGHADTVDGYRLIVGGQEFPGGGTSAVAPLWAALIARLNEAIGFQLGWINPILYHPEVAQAFRAVRGGTNDVADRQIPYFRARPAWNGCTGLGVPDGTRLLKAIQSMFRKAKHAK